MYLLFIRLVITNTFFTVIIVLNKKNFTKQKELLHTKQKRLDLTNIQVINFPKSIQKKTFESIIDLHIRIITRY